jgi:hypothetical protein
MDLYCDGDHPKWDIPFQEIGGQSYAQCARAAKKLGWKLSANKKHAFCSACAKPKPADGKDVKP